LSLSGGPSSPRAGSRFRGRGSAVAVVLAVVIITVSAGIFYQLTTPLPIKGPYVVYVYIPDGAGANSSLSFNPKTITLVVGVNNTVTWVDQDSSKGQVHTVTFGPVPAGVDVSQLNSAQSPGLADGFQFIRIFNVPGTYSYHCYYHSWMTGTIVVKA
jgi:plastocyanin